MPTQDPETIALNALSGAVADPTPKPLHGTATKPGIFKGAAQATKQASALAVSRGWVESTGEHVGKGKSRKELYRLTPTGLAYVLERGEPMATLQGLLGGLVDQGQLLNRLDRDLRQTRDALERHQDVVKGLAGRLAPPDVKAILAKMQKGPAQGGSGGGTAPAGWPEEVERYLDGFARRTGHGQCPLPELFKAVADPHRMTIGQFHDGIRKLVADRRIVLHPYTGSRYELQDEKYALLAGQEIKYYAERRTR